MCGDEPAFTQGFAKGLLARCFFRKPTCPSLNLKRSSKTHQSSLTLKGGSTSHLGLLPSGDKGCANRPFNSLYDPFGSPCRGQKPQGRRGNRPTRCFFSKTYPSFLTLKEGSTSLQASPFSEGKGCANRPTRSSNRYAIRLADHQRSTPAAELRFFVRG